LQTSILNQTDRPQTKHEISSCQFGGKNGEAIIKTGLAEKKEESVSPPLWLLWEKGLFSLRTSIQLNAF